MFFLIRLIITIAMLISIGLVGKKLKVRKNRLQYVLTVVIGIVVITLLSVVPLENLFVDFKSPQAAYEYTSWGDPDIELIVEGHNCDFVVERQDATYVYGIVPKTEKGWQIGIGSNTNTIMEYSDGSVLATIFQYNDTEDFFITIFYADGGAYEVRDSCNSTFYSLERTDTVLEKEYITYFAHITNYSQDYSIKINETHIDLPRQQ